MNFYNEFDPHAAAWLRELIARKLIPDGTVDERSITEIHASDLEGFTQCHFFAGIGGWSLALQLAGWPEDHPVWTGSCPCQPYSAAGKGLGDEDPRNLWPAFFRLIRECRPELVLGEQVADAIGKGWLDRVSADLEREGYACGAAVLGAHSVGAPHIRKRLYWVADAGRERVRGRVSGEDVGPAGEGESQGPERQRVRADAGDALHGMADSIRPGLQGQPGHGDGGNQPGRLDALAAGSTASGGTTDRLADTERDDRRPDQPQRGPEGRAANGGFGHWSDSHWLLCRDGKHRRVPTEPSLFPLADGLPYKLARRGSIRPALLKGAGNAIVPQVAAEFIQAFLEVTP